MENKGICVVCGNEYKIYHTSRQKYCSTNCRVKGNKDKNKEIFNFLKDEYKKPKVESEIIRTENTEWIILNQKLNKHQILKKNLSFSKKNMDNELQTLTRNNKEKIIAAFIGFGIFVVGGYILTNYLKKVDKDENKSLIKKMAVDIPIGVLIGGLGLIGGLIGYGIGSAISSVDNFKNRRLLKKISDLHLQISQIDSEIRLEDFNIADIENQICLIPKYSSVIETIKTEISKS
jgi:hypothetical protein